MADLEGVKIKTADNFRESFPGIMGILPSEAIEVAKDPDTQELIEMGEGSAFHIRVSVRRPNESKPYYLLVLDRIDEHGERVIHDAFKFFDDLCPDIPNETPIGLLTSLADRFAYLVRPGEDAKKLILQEGFPCDPVDVNADTIIRLMMPINMNKGEEVLGTQYVMYNDSKRTIEFAVAFVWNVTRYREYLAAQN